MRLLKIRINDFGKIHDKQIEFYDGINIIYGENEAGKSTIHSFIRGMLFDIKKTRGRAKKKGFYERYKPWNGSSSYGGSIEFEADNKGTYHIYRNFDKNNRVFTITDIDTGRELTLSELEYQELLDGLTESGYNGTISIEQEKAKANHELAFVLQNYITNLSMTKTTQVDVKQALKYLQDKKKNFNMKQLNEKILEISKEIEEGLQKESRIDELTIELKEIKEQIEDLKRQNEGYIEDLKNTDYLTREELNRLFTEFPVIKVKYGYYSDYLEQSKELHHKIMSLEQQINRYNSEPAFNTNLLKISLERLEECADKIKEIKAKKETDMEIKKSYLKQKGRRNKILAGSFVITGLLITLLFYGKHQWFPQFGILLFVIGIITFGVLSFLLDKERRSYLLHYNQYDKTIEKVKKLGQKILEENRVQTDQHLKEKYEKALKEELSIRQLNKEYEDYKDQNISLLHNINVLKRELMIYITNFRFLFYDLSKDILEPSDEAMGILEEYIIDQKLKADEIEKTLKKKLDALILRQEKIKWEISSIEDNEKKLLINQDVYKDLMIKQKEYQEEIEAISIAASTLESLSVDIYDSFGYQLNQLISEIGCQITEGRYQDIKVDEKLEIKAGWKDQYHKLEDFSTGTVAQLYLSLRIAASDLIYGKERMPIVLDDTFAYYDDTRLKSTLQLLGKSRRRQIILFTCHKREKELLDQMEIPHHYIEL